MEQGIHRSARDALKLTLTPTQKECLDSSWQSSAKQRALSLTVAFVAGLLSSFGEMEWSCADDPSAEVRVGLGLRLAQIGIIQLRALMLKAYH